MGTSFIKIQKAIFQVFPNRKVVLWKLLEIDFAYIEKRKFRYSTLFLLLHKKVPLSKVVTSVYLRAFSAAKKNTVFENYQKCLI